MTNTGPITRLARIADVPAIREMQTRSLLELGIAYYERRVLETFLELISTMDDAVVDEGHYFVTMTAEGRIAASGGWSQRIPSYEVVAGEEIHGQVRATAVVRSVFVDPDLPRRGLGKGIMATVERDAAAHGVQTLTMMATLSGVPFYDALGYRRLAPGHIDLGEVRFGYMRMEKTLVPSAMTAAVA